MDFGGSGFSAPPVVDAQPETVVQPTPDELARQAREVRRRRRNLNDLIIDPERPAVTSADPGAGVRVNT